MFQNNVRAHCVYIMEVYVCKEVNNERRQGVTKLTSWSRVTSEKKV